jgi:hypothetical protein
MQTRRGSTGIAVLTVNLGTRLGGLGWPTLLSSRFTLGKGPCYRLFTRLSGPWELGLDDAAYSFIVHTWSYLALGYRDPNSI